MTMTSIIDPALTIEKLQTMAEGQHYDRKSARLNERELARHISAMANASGGVIALGIEDNGFVSGVDAIRENAFRKVTTCRQLHNTTLNRCAMLLILIFF